MKAPKPSNSGTSNIKPMEAGMKPAVCIGLYDLGTQSYEYKGEHKELRKLWIAFEFPNEKVVYDEQKGEEPRLLGKEFTFSMHPKGNLRSFLETWRGKSFGSDAEAYDFDFDKLLGVKGLVVVSKTPSRNNPEKEYNDIMNVNPLMDGMSIPDAINEPLVFSFDELGMEEEDLQDFNAVAEKLPDFLVNKMKDSPEYKMRFDRS